MKVYNVGPDEEGVSGIPEDQFLWAIYWYKVGYYEGEGEAVALDKDGMLWQIGLSHCSCYAPFEASWEKSQTLEQFKSRDSVHDTQYMKEIESKIRELI